MVYCRAKLFLYVISTLHFINHVPALNMEDIRGGEFAQNYTFLYNVAIFKTDFVWMSGEIVCGGGIIAERYVLSAAQCFILKIDQIKNHIFFVAAGFTNKFATDIITGFIKRVFIPHYEPQFSTNDLAVLEMAKNIIQLNSYLMVSMLALPYPDQSFNSREGLVSGFGYNMVDVGLNPITGEPEIRKGTSSGLLKYGNVTIIDNDACRIGHPNFVRDMQMCGVMSSTAPRELSGICENDIGAPLVIDGIIAGVASRRNGNCDDTEKGSIYTNVSHYLHFIKAVLAGTPLPSETYTFPIRRY